MTSTRLAPSSRELVLLLLAIGVVYFGFSWTRPLANPDEPRYSEIPREMVASGDWVSPRLNGVLYLYKPPLFFWAEAVSYSIGGVNRFLLRFWPALCGFLGCLAVYLAGSRWFGRTTGIYAAAILASSILYFALSQLIILDMMLSTCMTGALLCYLGGIRMPIGPARRRAFWSFYLLTGLGVMTKGLIAILLPGAVIFIWFLLLNNWRQLRHLHLISGGLVFLAVVAPWHFLVHQRNEHWFDFYIVHEHFERYLSSVSRREQPIWFFFVIFPLGFFPWFGFVPQAFKSVFGHGWKARREHQEVWFLMIWIVFLLVFFSASKSKLIPYILPAYPPLALLLACYWRAMDEGGKGGSRAGGLAAAIFLIIGAIALPVAGHIQGRAGKLAGDATWIIILAALVFAVAGAWLIWRVRGPRPLRLRPLLYAFIPVALLLNPVVAILQPPSCEKLVARLKPLLEPGDLVYSYRRYIHGLPLYLDQNVGVIDAVPEEQSHGLEWEDHSDRYLERLQARRLWRRNEQRMLLVMPLSQEERFIKRIRAPCFEVVRDPYFVVFTNRPMPDSGSPSPVASGGAVAPPSN